MKNKSIILLISTLVGLLFYLNYYQKDGLVENISISNSNIIDSKIKNKPKIKKPFKQNEIFVSKNAQYILEDLMPVSKNELYDTWENEYGCYNNSIDDTDLYNCNSVYLTASSFEEALWMQRQGYPSSSYLQLLEDSRNIEYLKELADEKYVPAMTLLAINYLSKDNFEDASNISLKLRAYSGQSKTFPHRIRGEALLAKNDIYFGLSALKTASLLGDNEAQFLFNRYIHQYPEIAINATDHANLYMGRVFGVPYGQYPRDERPTGDGGG